MKPTQGLAAQRAARFVRCCLMLAALTACACVVTVAADAVPAVTGLPESGTVSLLCAGLLAMGLVRLGREAWHRHSDAARPARDGGAATGRGTVA